MNPPFLSYIPVTLNATVRVPLAALLRWGVVLHNEFLVGKGSEINNDIVTLFTDKILTARMYFWTS